MLTMRTSLTAALLSVMAAGLATGCSTAPKLIEVICTDTLGWAVLVYDDGSWEYLNDGEKPVSVCD